MAIPLLKQLDLRIVVRTMAVVVLERDSVLLQQIGDAGIVQSPVGNLVRGAAAAGPSREALLAQLDNLSPAELQSLLKRVLDGKQPA